MKTISAAEANRNFARVMKAAEGGETIIVTSHGTPRIKIEAVGGDADDAAHHAKMTALWAVHRKRLLSQPVKNLGKFSRDWAYDD
jgi:antitoxin (DNA-binding transcriptional repressor) of toxin-antitoxin stability system